MRQLITRRFATIAIAAAFGIVLGFLLRLSLGLGVPSLGDSSPAAAASQIEEKNKPITAIQTQLTEEERAVLDKLAPEPRSKRLLWFATQAEHADGGGMARLMRLAGDDVAIRQMIAVRWAQLDPQHMFDTLSVVWRDGDRYDYQILRILATEWSKIDPGAMVAALDDDHAFPGVDGARKAAADVLMMIDPVSGLGVLEKWNIRHYIPRMNKVTEWAKSDPRGAAETVAAIDADYASIEALRAVGRAWAGIDPAAALEFAAGLSGKKQLAFAEKVMAVFAADDLGAAIAFATAQEDIGFRGLIGAGLLAEWGKQDPAKALDWARDNLQSQLRSDAIGKLVGSLTKKDPQAAAALVSGMESSGAQYVAAQQLVETWVEATNGKSIAAAVEWLSTLPDHSLAQRVLNSAAWRMSYEDPRAFVGIVEGEHAHLIGREVIYKAVQTKVRESPQAALEWAQSLPADRAQKVEQSVVRNWISVQPGAASEWSTKLPAGERRDFAIDSVARSFLNRPAEQLGPWLGRLGESEQMRAREIVENLRATVKQKTALAAALAD